MVVVEATGTAFSVNTDSSIFHRPSNWLSLRREPFCDGAFIIDMLIDENLKGKDNVYWIPRQSNERTEIPRVD